MTKNLSTHITALLSGITSVVALVHPGFHINPVVQTIAFALPAVFAAALEALHSFKTHTLEANLLAASHVIQSIAANQEKPVA